jgi:regulator of sirC expression with transglutaminase-like and TPR domain
VWYIGRWGWIAVGVMLRISTVLLWTVLLLGGVGELLAEPVGSAKTTTVSSNDIAAFKRLLNQSEGQIDLAQAKVAIDHMVDPSVDVEATLRELDQWVAKIRARFPTKASNKVKAEVLISTLYKPGPWNDYKPFGYDYAASPYGSGDPRDALLSTYLAKRRGQCVIMPIFVVLLGQKLGLPMTLTTAPYHLIVKYGDEEQGFWTNLDATSGLFHPDEGYIVAMRIPELALKNEIYLRPHSQRESVALFVTSTLLLHYLRKDRNDLALQASELVLQANPRDVVAMSLRADAHIGQNNRKFQGKYSDPRQMPVELRAELIEGNRKAVALQKKADELGAVSWTKEDWNRYLNIFEDGKSKQQQGGG